jgi:hypothetical protein
MVLERTTLWSRLATRPETRNDYAGEDQQLFTIILCYAVLSGIMEDTYKHREQNDVISLIFIFSDNVKSAKMLQKVSVSHQGVVLQKSFSVPSICNSKQLDLISIRRNLISRSRNPYVYTALLS